MDHSESDSVSRYYGLSIFISLFVVFLYILSFNAKCRYFIRMTAFYMTISLNSIVATICWPLYFVCDYPKFIYNSFFVLSKWTGVECSLRNCEYLSGNGPFIIVSNHQSSIDVVVMSYCWPPNCTVLIKKSLKYVPFFNIASYLAKAVFVDRFNREKAAQSLDKCTSRIIANKLSVWVFPEGTRNHGDGMLDFKKGAFNIAVHAQIPIIPLVISSYRPFYSKDDRIFMNNGYVVVEVLQPIQTTGLTFDDVPKLTEQVRSKMIQVFERISKEAEVEYKRRTLNFESDKDI